jgi:hypothetical protein
MPQVQVISRQADPTAELISQSGRNLAATIQQSKALKIESAKLAAQAKMSEDKAKRTELLRKKDFIDHALKFKELGISDLKPLQEIYGDDTIPFAQHLGSVLREAPGSAQDQESLANARQSNANAGMLERMTQGSSSQGSGVPPGTSMGPSGLTIPLNPAVNSQESDSISKAMTLEKVLPDVTKAIDDGIFGKDSIQRTLNQSRVQDPNAMLTAGNPTLQEFQSNYNAIRRASLFDEAGKALTGGERKEMERKLSLVGKSDETIRKDLSELVEKATIKRKLLTQGLYGSQVKLGTPLSNEIERLPGAKKGGKRMTDANGNKAIVYPDGTFEEIQ